jgi:hypothetical protein
MPRFAFVLACLLTLLAACGDSDDEAGAGGPSPAAADLLVLVRPDGPDGPLRQRRIECVRVDGTADPPACRDLTRERLAPVPAATACAEIYGGPATARVTGTLRGERVDARFSRVNSCEIGRWERNERLLGPPGRVR